VGGGEGIGGNLSLAIGARGAGVVKVGSSYSVGAIRASACVVAGHAGRR